MNAMRLFTWICLLGFAAAARAGSGDAEKGKVSYAVCVACHGAKGEGNKAFNAPRLAGQEEWYLKAQLRKFKQGIRGYDPKDIYGLQMAPMAKILADEASIDHIVAYIRSLKAQTPPDRSTAGDADKGKALYATCATCHGPKGEGNIAQKAPRLLGQHAWYIERQLRNFKSGLRGAHPQDLEGKLMAPMSLLLTTDQAIADVVAYIQSLDEASQAAKKP